MRFSTKNYFADIRFSNWPTILALAKLAKLVLNNYRNYLSKFGEHSA
jgi:hypothetical protein